MNRRRKHYSGRGAVLTLAMVGKWRALADCAMMLDRHSLDSLRKLEAASQGVIGAPVMGVDDPYNDCHRLRAIVRAILTARSERMHDLEFHARAVQEAARSWGAIMKAQRAG